MEKKVLPASMCLSIDYTTLWNCTGGVNSILPICSLNDGDEEHCLMTVKAIA